ncbi:hypothetical protein Tco_0323839 [Tanacetum coccineum]
MRRPSHYPIDTEETQPLSPRAPPLSPDYTQASPYYTPDTLHSDEVSDPMAGHLRMDRFPYRFFLLHTPLSSPESSTYLIHHPPLAPSLELLNYVSTETSLTKPLLHQLHKPHLRPFLYYRKRYRGTYIARYFTFEDRGDKSKAEGTGLKSEESKDEGRGSESKEAAPEGQQQ